VGAGGCGWVRATLARAREGERVAIAAGYGTTRAATPERGDIGEEPELVKPNEVGVRRAKRCGTFSLPTDPKKGNFGARGRERGAQRPNLAAPGLSEAGGGPEGAWRGG